jgi:hypothetical protein
MRGLLPTLMPHIEQGAESALGDRLRARPCAHGEEAARGVHRRIGPILNPTLWGKLWARLACY